MMVRLLAATALAVSVAALPGTANAGAAGCGGALVNVERGYGGTWFISSAPAAGFIDVTLYTSAGGGPYWKHVHASAGRKDSWSTFIAPPSTAYVATWHRGGGSETCRMYGSV